MSCSHFYFVSKAVFEATSSCMQQQANHPLVLFVCNSFGCAQSRVDSRWKTHTYTHTHTRDCVAVVRGGDCRRRKRLFLLCRQVAIDDLLQLLYMHLDLRRHKSGSFLGPQNSSFSNPKLHLQHSSLFNP
jgi:hypothetical protein